MLLLLLSVTVVACPRSLDATLLRLPLWMTLLGRMQQNQQKQSSTTTI